MHRFLWRAPADGLWTGRVDGENVDHARWHQVIRTIEPGDGQSGDVALIGFLCDEGVRRNHGRPGAAEAPMAIRRALAPLSVGAFRDSGTPVPFLHDAGDITIDGDDLEGAQDALGAAVARLLDSHRLVVVLGGGHETAYGSYLGRCVSNRYADKQAAVLNLDAHFDLRDAPEPTSGTPFLQMAEHEEIEGRFLDYTVLGISAAANTRALFDTMDRCGGSYLLDTECTPRHLDRVLTEVDALLERAEVVHLSIDMDVLPAAEAPGVSAPASFGVPMETILEVCHTVAASGKLAVVDIVEVLPRLDVDGRTSRAAARLVSAIVEALT